MEETTYDLRIATTGEPIRIPSATMGVIDALMTKIDNKDPHLVIELSDDGGRLVIMLDHITHVIFTENRAADVAVDAH